MSDRDDEAEERERQRKERRRLMPKDRWYGRPPLTTKTGSRDLRSDRRTGRTAQMNVHMTPRVRAMIVAIMGRDQPPSWAVLFEEMVQAYLDKAGPLDPGLVPSDEELAEQIEDASDEHGE